MMSTTQLFLLINLTGGIAVLGSYFVGLRSSPDLAEGLWGGVTGNLRIYFTLSMLLAALGYLTFCYSFVFSGLGTALSDSGLAIATISLIGIFLISASIWMPANIQYLNTSNLFWWFVSVIVLWTTALSLLILTILVVFFPPDSLETSVRYITAIGLGWITFHCLVLDACIWVALFKHP